MLTKNYKVITLSTLMALVTASNLVPGTTYAAQKAGSSQTISAAASNSVTDSNVLGPEGLKEAIEKTGSNTLAMDLYALTILKQENVNFSSITSLDDSLKKKVLHHQVVAKGNANQWLDAIKPQIVLTNQNIISYDAKFQKYYAGLAKAIKEKDKGTLTTGLTNLTESISKNKEQVDLLVKDLKNFRDKLVVDTQNFKEDSNRITSILASQDAGIPLLQQQLETFNKAASKYNGLIIGSAFATALGPISIVAGSVIIGTGLGVSLGLGLIATGVAATGAGVTGIIVAKKELDRARIEIQNLTGKITQAQLEVAGLTKVKAQTEYLANTIDASIISLQNISNQWLTMETKYTSLLQSVKVINPDKLGFITEDLEIAKDSWKDIKGYAEKIYTKDIQITTSN
ncbi:non-hemolytic enterotoxin subunit B [Bacillus cereus]|uniref:non-hemolytic enterotoxin subunit B n=1 Tax=Bacillus cereus TaxID=1396 RepID=UPI0018CCB9DF|nr:HBL/NHE enterotoxin family protein [Bacillus cereus]MBG9612220.1 enterotoxin [Bacillus cereus]